MALLLVDNYDSFTYNLVHLLEPMIDVVVQRNNEIDFETLENFSHIVLSPGPGLPKDAGDLYKVIDACFGQKPIFGVCLGLQALAEFTGGKLYNQESVKHGVSKEISIESNSILFQGLESPINVGLYHSWAVEESSIEKDWNVVSKSMEGVVMAMEHKRESIAGVQFHPESIMTCDGKEIVKNWLMNSRVKF